ncbi:MAG: 3-oxoacyl-[acyl-carrier-protein] synthase III C-terminal domain-containing protein [Propionibacterium sp.]|jgi:3-oxoacyl-[acyl-carrier-protein] synthase-3|nr:3-oxoacyl-[acyl-carrier-protein] synthase III C-terminal domain-containing protein [Propionibacterium sp.]
MPTTRISGVATHLPERTQDTADTEVELRQRNGHLRLATGLISRLTGVQRVHVRPEGWQASDLAVAAARKLIDEQPGDIDLLMFASASQDLIEPATSHIVSAKLGLSAPVFDVKNACNSVINALQVADALIQAGSHRRILIVSGEAPTSAVRWQLRDRAQFVRSFPGYSMSDGGAAVLLEADESCQRGIQAATFHALSRHWNIGTLPGGGTVAAHDPDMTYFDMDGSSLQRAFLELGPEPITTFLRQQRRKPTDFDFVAIHQVSVPFLPPILERLGVPADRTIVTVADHGNLASVTLPLQLELARRRGMIGPGSLVLLIGLAGGISLGLMAVRL